MKKISFAKFAIIAFALVFIIHQSISSFYKPITTESAVYYTMSDGINITGVIIRNEILVQNNNKACLQVPIKINIHSIFSLP